MGKRGQKMVPVDYWRYGRAYVPTAGRTAVWMIRQPQPLGGCPDDPLWPENLRNGSRVLMENVSHRNNKTRIRVRCAHAWVRWFEKPTAADLAEWRRHKIGIITPHGEALREKHGLPPADDGVTGMVDYR